MLRKRHNLACVPDVFCRYRTPLLLQLGHPRKRADKAADTGPTEQLPGSPAFKGHRVLSVRVMVQNCSLNWMGLGIHLGELLFSILLSRPKDPVFPGASLSYEQAQALLPVDSGHLGHIPTVVFPFHLSNERV